MLAQSPEREAHDEVFDNSRSNWNLEMLVSEERGKPEYPEKNLSEQGREPTNSTHISAVASNRPTEVLTSVISLAFVVYST